MLFHSTSGKIYRGLIRGKSKLFFADYFLSTIDAVIDY